MSANKPAMILCQKYIECVETKDLRGVEQTLADDVRQIFCHTKHVTDPGMFDQVSSGERKGTIVAVMKGQTEVSAYTKGLMSNFRKIKWVDTKWKVSDSSKEVYLFGKGDMITEKTEKPYRNVYVTRFDLRQDRISEINEIGNAMLYMRLGIAPNATQMRAFGRALLRPFGIGLR